MGTFCDFLFSGVGLDALDFNGSSDPYIVIKVPSDAKSPDSSFTMNDFEGQVTQTAIDNSINPPAYGYDPIYAIGAVVVSFTTRALIHQARKTHKQTPGYYQIYESEVIKKNLDPSWDPFRLDFYNLCKGDMDAQILIECYDWNRIGSSSLIGSFLVEIQDLVNDKPNGKFYQLFNEEGRQSGQLKIKSKFSTSTILCCDFKVHGTDLAERGVLGLSDPYLVVLTQDQLTEEGTTISSNPNFRLLPDRAKRGIQLHDATQGYREVYESEVIKKNLNPAWNPFRVSFYDLCKGNSDVLLAFQCWDYNTWSSNKLIGVGSVSVQQLLDAKGSFSLALYDRKQRKSGTLFIDISCRESGSHYAGNPSM